MAVGDAVGDVSGSIAGGGTGTVLIRPDEGIEWCIHNIVASGNVGLTYKISLTDGVSDIDFDTGSTSGGWINQTFFLTHTHYLKLTNTHATIACYFGYTGVITKST